MNVTEIVLEFLELRHSLERDLRIVALDLDDQRCTCADADDALHVGEAFNLLAVDRQNQVAGLEAGCLGGAARLDRIDARSWSACRRS